MKRYGIQLISPDGHAARFIEMRGLGFIAGTVLGALFGEFWLIVLGLALVVFGWLAEWLGETALLIAAVIPISLLLWVLSSFVGMCEFFPGSAVFCVVSYLLIQDGMKAFNPCEVTCCKS